MTYQDHYYRRLGIFGPQLEAIASQICPPLTPDAVQDPETGQWKPYVLAWRKPKDTDREIEPLNVLVKAGPCNCRRDALDWAEEFIYALVAYGVR